jgi:hypothetical protein
MTFFKDAISGGNLACSAESYLKTVETSVNTSLVLLAMNQKNIALQKDVLLDKLAQATYEAGHQEANRLLCDGISSLVSGVASVIPVGIATANKFGLSNNDNIKISEKAVAFEKEFNNNMKTNPEAGALTDNQENLLHSPQFQNTVYNKLTNRDAFSNELYQNYKNNPNNSRIIVTHEGADYEIGYYENGEPKLNYFGQAAVRELAQNAERKAALENVWNHDAIESHHDTLLRDLQANLNGVQAWTNIFGSLSQGAQGIGGNFFRENQANQEKDRTYYNTGLDSAQRFGQALDKGIDSNDQSLSATLSNILRTINTAS